MILFYDTETTGFPDSKRSLDEQPRVVQLGAILANPERKEMQRLDMILRLGDVPANVLQDWTVGKDGKGGAAAIHGISPEISEQIGITEVLVIEAFCDLVAVADLVVGHNHVSFDNKIMTNVVRRVLGRPDADPFAGKAMFDTILAGMPLMKLPARQGGYRKPKLIDLHKHLIGEGFEDAHTAIADVLATQRCYYAMEDMVAAKMREKAA
ncbi:putative Pol III-like exoribonuclease [Caulobacter phage CcrSwift]|uniref:Putative Pol III-like exoribonuclease n=1 Tax=Caulobacter phage CcrSwift TaxID=2927984 RepID=K4JTK0_9CAUD|nr:putative Pol III-like exoribonuclease [Caulobacter phage CcrSwift]AFU88436.1 putative Pol III-like exoribonuclease [Caulobacter phage CcrSwift]